jgi:hypothetical protein
MTRPRILVLRLLFFFLLFLLSSSSGFRAVAARARAAHGQIGWFGNRRVHSSLRARWASLLPCFFVLRRFSPACLRVCR